MNYPSWLLHRLRLNRIKRLKGNIAFHEAKAAVLRDFQKKVHTHSERQGLVEHEGQAAKYRAILKEEEGD